MGLAAAVGAFLLVMLWAWSGIYSVAASRGHWPIVEWFLTFVMSNSVKTHALGVETPPPLDNKHLIQLGAGHFHSECATCHGAPGFAAGVVAQQMLPPPPDLALASPQWKDRELFWIVRNGIKYTGMPGWPSLERDDEVWAVVAFLRELPRLSARQYRELAFGGLPVPTQSGREIANVGNVEEALGACGRCHGMEHQRPQSGLVPLLHGQPAEFLVAALRSYADGTRQSGIMQPVAKALSAGAMQRTAEYYAGLKIPADTGGARPESAQIDRGREIATRGIVAAEVPPCLGCHGDSALPTFPRLAGQNAHYMIAKLRLWKNGLEPHTGTAEIMAPIARRLSDQQIVDLSAYFAALPQGERRP
jgi:cytochrome c553